MSSLGINIDGCLTPNSRICECFVSPIKKASSGSSEILLKSLDSSIVEPEQVNERIRSMPCRQILTYIQRCQILMNPRSPR